MKKIKSALLGGILFVLLVGVPTFLVLQIWNVVSAIADAAGFRVFEYRLLNTATYALILLAILCVLGWIFKVRIFRNLIDALISKIPIVSVIVKFIPKTEEVESLNAENLKEVRAEMFPGVWLLGLLTKKIKRGGKLIYRVYHASCPFPPTGYIAEYEESRVEYTGGGADDYFAKVVSYGIRSSDKEKEKPQ